MLRCQYYNPEHDEETGNRDGRVALVPVSIVTTLRGEHSEREGGNVASTVVNYQLRGNYGNRYKSRRRESRAGAAARR